MIKVMIFISEPHGCHCLAHFVEGDVRVLLGFARFRLPPLMSTR
jgi:hypothetical protein